MLEPSSVHINRRNILLFSSFSPVLFLRFPHFNCLGNQYIWPPWWLRRQRIFLQCGTPGFNLWVRKIHWGREWQPIPHFNCSLIQYIYSIPKGHCYGQMSDERKIKYVINVLAIHYITFNTIHSLNDIALLEMRTKCLY